MKSAHLVDPELKSFLEAWNAVTADGGAVSEAWIPVRRQAVEDMIANTAVPDGLPVHMEERFVEGAPGSPPVGIVIYSPTHVAGPWPAVFHVHGGGYVVGRPRMMEAGNLALVADLGCVLVSVDYRLAPETPHPGPIEDCYAALKWLYQNAAAINVDCSRIGVMGESAGGGLAAALALLARDRGEIPLHFQHLVAPMLDDRTCVARDVHPYTGEFLWRHADNTFGWASLLGTAPGSEGISPYAAAARAEDLSGLPPTFISVGALDLFLETTLRNAAEFERSGQPLYPVTTGRMV